MVSPEQASGSDVDATIFLAGHQRCAGEHGWHGGHQAQTKRRYVSETRASQYLALLVEGPRPTDDAHFADNYWSRVVAHYGAQQEPLMVGERLRRLGWREDVAHGFANACGRTYRCMDWESVAARLRSAHPANSAKRFFTSKRRIESEFRTLSWRPRRQLPTEADGYARTQSLVVEGHEEARGFGGASLTGLALEQARQEISRWRTVLLPSWTAIVSGSQSSFLDFVFLPEWLEGVKQQAQKGMQLAFENFITALFTVVGAAEGQRGWGEYTRRIDFHKLEEERDIRDLHSYTYFFRHCWSTRVCVKLQGGGSGKDLLYGYNGMGLHRCHPSWWSLVVRSRSAGLTARILSVLGLPCNRRDFLDAVPEGCKHSYDECMGLLEKALVARDVELAGRADAREGLVGGESASEGSAVASDVASDESEEG